MVHISFHAKEFVIWSILLIQVRVLENLLQLDLSLTFPALIEVHCLRLLVITARDRVKLFSLALHGLDRPLVRLFCQVIPREHLIVSLAWHSLGQLLRTDDFVQYPCCTILISLVIVAMSRWLGEYDITASQLLGSSRLLLLLLLGRVIADHWVVHTARCTDMFTRVRYAGLGELDRCTYEVWGVQADELWGMIVTLRSTLDDGWPRCGRFRNTAIRASLGGLVGLLFIELLLAWFTIYWGRRFLIFNLTWLLIYKHGAAF